MRKHFLYGLFLLFSTLSYAQKPHLSNTLLPPPSDSLREMYTKVNIETPEGAVLRGELADVDMEEEHVVLRTASDSSTIKFKNVYKVYEGNFDGATGYHYRIDAPERFFYTPMGNTMRKGMVSLENYLFVNNQIKVGVTDRLEVGVGLTVYPQENIEDTSVSALPMASIKYKFIDRRHLKASIGAVSAQLPDVFTLQNVADPHRAWLNILYASADWQYKFGTFSFAMAQPYMNLYPLKKATTVVDTRRGLDYMVSASYSVKVFPFAHFISENIFFSGAWNTLGRPNTIARDTYLLPLLGGRYYGDYYSFAGGFSNVLIPNAVLFFYLGGTYYFE